LLMNRVKVTQSS